MNQTRNLLDKMRDMRRQLREGGPQAATIAIQRALRDAGLSPAANDLNAAPRPATPQAEPRHQAPFQSQAQPQPQSTSASGHVMHDINPPPAGKAAHASPDAAASAAARPHPAQPTPAAGANSDFVNDLLAKFGVSTDGLLHGAMAGRSARQAQEDLPAGAKFLSGSFSNAAGSRNYKLYVPASASAEHGSAGAPLPLVVMLHGCTQDPDDFAAGTQMNATAELQRCLVLYPQQPQSANSSKCWNWFNAGDQERDAGEPSIIAGMTREIMAQHAVDPAQVYVAGLSAGGAMAAIMGIAYPDLYAGVAVHSGLPYGAATDLPSALAAMRSGVAGSTPRPRGSADGQRFKGIPIIVFHGDADHTVNRRNGEQVLEATAPPAHGAASQVNGQVPNGHTYTRTVHRDAAGKPVAEHWLIHGFGHAWAGGSARGSYTDGRGPDATGEIMRFFQTHRKAA
jgi:poly(hydroxyalkanoate) depolymerase family esterase